VNKKGEKKNILSTVKWTLLHRSLMEVSIGPCFIVSYLNFLSFIFSLFKHYFLSLLFTRFLLVLFSDLKNRYKLKIIFEMLVQDFFS